LQRAHSRLGTAASHPRRAITLVLNRSGRTVPQAAQAGIPVQEVQFYATDGVRLDGWLAIADAHAPTIILVHGFKGSRFEMLPSVLINSIHQINQQKRDHKVFSLWSFGFEFSSKTNERSPPLIISLKSAKCYTGRTVLLKPPAIVFRHEQEDQLFDLDVVSGAGG
jgi:hypothetical protein